MDDIAALFISRGGGPLPVLGDACREYTELTVMGRRCSSYVW